MKKITLAASVFAALAAAAAAFAQSGPSDPVIGAGKGVTNTIHPIENYIPVTDAMLRKPDPNDWLMLRGNYEGFGFSPLRQVNKTNVKSMQMVWARLMTEGVNEGTPIVHNGVMFLPNAGDVIQALDAATGSLLWEHKRTLPTLQQMHNNAWGKRKRSVFLYKDRVIFNTWDNFIVALDAKTGKQLWEMNRGGDLYATNTNGPIVVDGVIISGSVCQQAPFGCYVTGNDAETGKELWRNTFIPKPGEPGDETWGKVPFEKRWGTGVWGPIIYDPEQNLVHYGTSGVIPGSEAQRGQVGLSLAGTNTRYAVEPKTGKVVWKHQVLPRDNWDQECTFEMMPITTAVKPDSKAEGMMAIGAAADGKPRRTLVGMPCKTGIMWSFDAAKGDFLWAKSTIYQTLISSIDNKGLVKVNEAAVMDDINKTVRQCPTYAGGRDVQFSAYNPVTKVMFFPLQNSCTDIRARIDNIPSQPFDEYNTRGRVLLPPGKTNFGRLDAVSIETGKTVWTWETPAAVRTPALATASGLLFNGGMDRYFRAFDQVNGKVLWQTRLGSQAFGTSTTFMVKGKQYVAVTAGGGMNGASASLFPKIDQPAGGNMVYVFALPD